MFSNKVHRSVYIVYMYTRFNIFITNYTGNEEKKQHFELPSDELLTDYYYYYYYNFSFAVILVLHIINNIF